MSQRNLTSIRGKRLKFLPDIDLEAPKTPLADPKGMQIPSPELNSTSTSTRTVRTKRTHKPHREEIAGKLTQSISRSRRSPDENWVSRKNFNLEPAANSETQKSGNGKSEKRVLRSFIRGNASEVPEKKKSRKCDSIVFPDKGKLLDEHKDVVGVDLSKQFMCTTLAKKNPPSSCKGNAAKLAKKSVNGKCSSLFNDCLGEGVLPDEGHSLLGVGVYEKSMDKSEKKMDRSYEASSAILVGTGVKEGGDIERGCKAIGVKNNRDQVEDGEGIQEGWTKDQELALERAYWTAKPTPQFWKQVARLVPGKSAKDCFDKVHSNHLTPPQPRSRSRARILNSSPPSLSASKLLKNTSRSKEKKQKSHIVQKSVRYMLEKQCLVDTDSAADLFSVLEPTPSPSTQCLEQNLVLSTPEHNREKLKLLNGCEERSSSPQKNNLSRSSSLPAKSLLSPPVLKQVKNKALHEKYIDLLHRREASRKAASARVLKSKQHNGVVNENDVQIKDVIESAKIALVFDARDAINQFQHLQSNAMMLNFSDEDGDAESNEDEGEEAF